MGAGSSREGGGGGPLSALTDRLPQLGSFHVVMIGLDSAGKTTILYRLKFGQYVNSAPTIGFNCEKVRINGAAFTVWDVGGQDKMRPLWRSYTRGTDAIIFVVDSSKADRLEEASLELQRFCKTSVPVLVLANKQDLPGALEAAELEQKLGLSKLGASDARVQAVCAVTGDGLDEGIAVLQDMIAASKGSRKKSKGGKLTGKLKRANSLVS